MAKSTRSQTLVRKDQTQGVFQEHKEVFDDSLLPEACEIEALSRLDPDIVHWLKSRAEKEQEFRHNAHNRKLEIAGKVNKNESSINLLGVIFAFVIIVLGMFFSAFLIHKKHLIAGTIFSGATILYAAYLFLNRQKEDLKKKK